MLLRQHGVIIQGSSIQDRLMELLLQAVANRALSLPQNTIKTQAEFLEKTRKAKTDLVTIANEVSKLTEAVFDQYATVMTGLEEKKNVLDPNCHSAINDHLLQLMSADFPNLVKNAKKIPQISYEEMLELASQGAKVLQTRSVELAMRKKTKLSVRSSMKPKTSGTVVTEENSKLENNTVSGIAYSKDEAKITLSRVLDKPGVSSKIFGPLAKGNINVDMILQNVSQDGKFANLSFTLPRGDLEKALKILKKEKTNIGYI